jgi:hypothetical protein
VREEVGPHRRSMCCGRLIIQFGTRVRWIRGCELCVMRDGRWCWCFQGSLPFRSGQGFSPFLFFPEDTGGRVRYDFFIFIFVFTILQKYISLLIFCKLCHPAVSNGACCPTVTVVTVLASAYYSRPWRR